MNEPSDEVFVEMVDADDDANVMVIDGAIRPVHRRRDEGMWAYPGLLLSLNKGAGGDGQGGRGGGLCYSGKHGGGEGLGEVRPP